MIDSKLKPIELPDVCCFGADKSSETRAMQKDDLESNTFYHRKSVKCLRMYSDVREYFGWQCTKRRSMNALKCSGIYWSDEPVYHIARSPVLPRPWIYYGEVLERSAKKDRATSLLSLLQ